MGWGAGVGCWVLGVGWMRECIDNDNNGICNDKTQDRTQKTQGHTQKTLTHTKHRVLEAFAVVIITVSWMYFAAHTFGRCQLVPEEWQAGEYGRFWVCVCVRMYRGVW